MNLELLKLENDQVMTIDSQNYNKNDLKNFFNHLSDAIEVEVGSIGSTELYHYDVFEDFIDNLNFIINNGLNEKDISVLTKNLYPNIVETVNTVANNIEELAIYPCKNEEELGLYYFEESIKPELEDNINPKLYNTINSYFNYQAIGRDLAINNNIVFGNEQAYELINL